jgi:hypothetical protein
MQELVWSNRGAIITMVVACAVIVQVMLIGYLMQGSASAQDMRRKLLELAQDEVVDTACEGFLVPNKTTDCMQFWDASEANLMNNCSQCWEPPGPALDFSRRSELQKRFNRKPIEPRIMCHGIQDYTRVCLFRDILWDLQEKTWVMFGAASQLLPAMGGAPERGAPWLRLDRCAAAPSTPLICFYGLSCFLLFVEGEETCSR